MAHEQIIRNGVIVENSFQFKGTGIIVTGITNVGPLSNNQYKLVTENTIYNALLGTILSNLSGVTITNPLQDDILVYSGGTWVNASSPNLDEYYTKIDADYRFVNVTGDTMTGDLTVPNIIVNALLKTTNTNISSNLVVTGTSTYYNDLTINGNIVITGTVDGIDISNIYSSFTSHTGNTSNPHHTTLANLSGNTIITPTTNDILIFSGNTWLNVPITTVTTNSYTIQQSDNLFVHKTGDTMTGPLVINSSLTVNGYTTIIGDLYVSGTTTTINSTNVSIKDNIITINSGETNTGVTLLTAGIKIDRGAGTPYYFVFDELSDTFRVGLSDAIEYSSIVTSGDTHALAARQDNPNASGITFWDNNHKYLITNPNITIVGNDIVTSGLVDGVDVSTFYSNFNSHTGNTSNPHNTTLANLSGNTITTPINGDILYYNNSGIWVNTPISIIGDSRYVTLTGATMTGTLNVPNTNISSNLVVTGTSTFYNTMTVNSNIVITGTVDGVDISLLNTTFNSHTGNTNNPHNTTLSNLSGNTLTSVTQGDVIYYSGGTWLNTQFTTLIGNTTYTKTQTDNLFVHKTGDTMTGDLLMGTLTGTTNRIVYVDNTGKLTATESYVFKSSIGSIAAGTTVVDSFASTLSKGVVWHYVVTDGTNYRAGTVTAVWNGNTSGSTVEYNETSTNDIGTTTGISFTSNIITGGNIRLLSVVTIGTWTVSTSRLMIG
jgi:hypothetical protein